MDAIQFPEPLCFVCDHGKGEIIRHTPHGNYLLGICCMEHFEAAEELCNQTEQQHHILEENL